MPSEPLSPSAAAMIARLYMSGAMAAMAKRLYELSTLEQNVLTAKMAGVMSSMRVRLATVSRNAASWPATHTSMIERAKMASTTEVTSTMRKKMLMTELVRYQASSSRPVAW